MEAVRGWDCPMFCCHYLEKCDCDQRIHVHTVAGLIAQLVVLKHCTVIAEARRLNLIQAWIFFRLLNPCDVHVLGGWMPPPPIRFSEVFKR